MRPTEPLTPSAVPGVIDDLVAGLTKALGADTDVIDGPAGPQQSLRADVVMVGVGPPSSSAEATQTRQGWGGRPSEQFTVHCVLSSTTGDVDIRARRVRAYELLAAIATFLRGETLGDTCDELRLGDDIALLQDQTNKGAVAEVAFDISGRALL